MFLNIVQVVEVLYSNLEVYIELKAIIKFRVLEKFTKFLKNNKCFHLPPPWRWGYAMVLQVVPSGRGRKWPQNTYWGRWTSIHISHYTVTDTAQRLGNHYTMWGWGLQPKNGGLSFFQCIPKLQICAHLFYSPFAHVSRRHTTKHLQHVQDIKNTRRYLLFYCATFV